MERATWRLAVLVLLAATACAGEMSYGAATPAAAPDGSASAPPPVAAEAQTQTLFTIERNKNANVVHYDARLAADGKLDPKEPVIAYWIMLAVGGRRQYLNFVEKKKAYGFDIKPGASANEYKMAVVSAPDRQITVKKVGDAVQAQLAIDGHPAVLERMYINATEGLLGPTVNYIELHGKDLQTGEKRFEKVVPK